MKRKDIKFVRLKPQTHFSLKLYSTKNRLRSLDKAIEKLLIGRTNG